MAQRLLHKRSSVKDKVPTTAVAEEGEILLNTNAQSPMLAIRTSSSTIAVFKDSGYYDTELGKKSNTGHTHAISDVTNLQTTLNGKSDTGHTHDDRYYTETEMDTKLSGKLSTGTTYAASDSVGGSANSTKGTLTITSNGTSLGTFNGSQSVTAATTDQKVADVASNSTAYLLGHTNQNTTATTVTKSTVFMNSGTLNAQVMQVNGKVQMAYNATEECLDFLFI